MLTTTTDTLPPDTQAVLLLCGTFTHQESTKPLTPAQYHNLAVWLHQIGRRPADLLNSTDGLLPPDDPKLGTDRVQALLERGMQMAMALERWEGLGLWVMSRGEERYPDRLRRKLGSSAPPLLFGAGDISRLDKGGLAIVGSRDAGEDTLNFTCQVAERCASQDVQVISGGARGVDQASVRAALESDGGAVCVLADRLDRVATSRDAKEPLRRGCLTLVTPYAPESGFSVGNAMGRNKHIYALADFALVVQFTTQEGGTWAGAIDQLDRNTKAGSTCVPVFVRLHQNNSEEGWRTLHGKGARPFPQEDFLRGNIAKVLGDYPASPQEMLAESPPSEVGPAATSPNGTVLATPERTLQVEPDTSAQEETPSLDAVPVPPLLVPTLTEADSCYDRCLPLLLQQLRQEKSTKELKEVAKRLDLQWGQLTKWLKRAVKEEKVIQTKGRSPKYRDASVGAESTLYDQDGDAA